MVMAALLLVLLLVFWYRHETKRYVIEADEASIVSAIARVIEAELTMHTMMEQDDHLLFVFTSENGAVGTGQLSRGMNGKYKFVNAGYGSNVIRERIIRTNRGHYLMFAGKNVLNIRRIEADVDEQQYGMEIPDGEYFLVLTPIHKTTSDLASAWTAYDRDGKEIERTNRSE